MANEELKKELKRLQDIEKQKKEEILLKNKIDKLNESNRKKGFIEKIWDKI